MSNQQHFAIYQAAEKRVRDNGSANYTGKDHDLFIVDLWDASRNLFDKNTKLADELNTLKKRNGEMFNTIDRLESQVAKLRGDAPIWSPITSGTGTALSSALPRTPWPFASSATDAAE